MNMGNEKVTNYQHWAVVAVLLTLSATIASLHQFKIPTIMNEIIKSFNMTLEQAALTMSIFTFAGIFLSLPGGRFAQKFGPKNTVLIAAVFMAAGSLLGSIAASSNIFILSRGIEGVGFILFTLCGPIAITQYVEPKKLGSAMGIWAVWVNVGQVIAFNLTPLLYNSIGYSGTWITYSVLSLVMGCAVLFGIKTRKELNPGNTERSSARTLEVFKNKDLWLLCLSYVTFTSFVTGIFTFVPSALTEKGMSVAGASFAASLPMLLGIAASPIFGAISDKIGSGKSLHLISLFAMLPGAIMMFSSTGILMYAGAVVIGLLGLGHPVIAFASVSKVNSKPELTGTSIGFLVAFSQLGMFFGSMLMPFFLKVGGSWATASWFLLPVTVIGLILGALSEFK